MSKAKAESGVQVYVDDGCDSFPACLRCPLDECKYVDPMALTRWKNRERDAQVLELLAQGLSAPTIGEKVGIGERTVHRIQRKALLKV